MNMLKEYKCNKCGGTGGYSRWDGHKFSHATCKECNGSGIVKIGCWKQLYKASGEFSSMCGQNYNARVRICQRCKRLDKKYDGFVVIDKQEKKE